MSIDTPQKRYSVFQLPGLMMNPMPNVNMTQSDRQQMADIYVGITPVIPAGPPDTTIWTNSLNNDSIWKQDKENTTSWVKQRSNAPAWVATKSNTSIWVNEEGTTKDWYDEKEVTAIRK